jgi:hypothetical protein
VREKEREKKKESEGEIEGERKGFLNSKDVYEDTSRQKRQRFN